jgi:site-specific recombinase XerD
MAKSKPLANFLTDLSEQGLSDATRSAYNYDLQKFNQWFEESKGYSLELEKLSAIDLLNYRQFLLNVRGLKPATINRALEALRKFCRWAYQHKLLKKDVSASLKPVRFTRNRQPAGLVEPEVHALLRVAGETQYGLAARNYALVQMMLQTGLRVGEVAALKIRDVTVRERTGSVIVRQGKGLKEREVPLNATVRRALRNYLDERESNDSQDKKKSKINTQQEDDPLFLTERNKAMPKRTIQAVITNLGKKAKIKRVKFSSHTLRHTFALNYLKQNPGKLVELANLLGHESLDTTAVYLRPSNEELAADLERSSFNNYG